MKKIKETLLRGDEGMWPLNMVPRERLQALHGVSVNDEWLTQVQHASVRMNNGGSASFVSGDGLIATNHHVAASILYQLSDGTRDLMRDGFLAKTRADELPAPQLEVNVLWEIEDVTQEVHGALATAKTSAERRKKRRAAIATIEQNSKEKTGLRSDVVTLYNGGKYHLYRYRRYTDVRLVFAPEAAIAAFGGDIDNYEYPRYCLDVTFFRVYENGKPLQTPEHFSWGAEAPKMGETLFVAGHPGTTERLTTYDRLRLLRDRGLPHVLNYLRRQEILLEQYGGRSPENARRAEDRLHSIRNIRKRFMGQLASVQSEAFMQTLRKREETIRAAVRNNPALRKKTGRAWEEVEKASEVYDSYRDEYLAFEGARGFSSGLFTIARTIVRLAEEDPKPNAKRLGEYGDARRQSLLERLYSPAPIYKDLEETLLADGLRLLVETFGFADTEVRNVLNGEDIEVVAKKLIRGTKLDSVATRKRLVKGGANAVATSKDPLIHLARLVDKRARKVREVIETQVESPIEEAYGHIVDALFALYGESLYPDATFTLRLTYGNIVPYDVEKVPEQKYTTIGGVFAHGKRHNNEGAWKLPASWQKHEKKLVSDKSAFNFITTHDTHGGNSGSPVFTKDMKIVGLLFDGLVHTQGADSFMYQADEKNHTVCVHAEGILSVLTSVYGAKNLVRELSQG